MTERGNGPSAGEWLARARTFRLEGRFGEAVDACRRALDLEPADGRAWSELAHALRWQGQPYEALQAANRAIETAPGLASAWFNLGAALEGRQQLERAEEAYRKALGIDPDYPEAWSNLGGVLGEQGKRAEEIDAYRRALGIEPLLAPVWSNLGNALRESGALDEAVQACRRATELDPALAAAWNNLGSALHDGGRHEEAIEACRCALQIEPELAHAWNNLGGSLRSVYRYDEAVEAHRHAIQAQPGSAPFHFNFGVTLQHCGRTDDAIAQFRSTLEMKPDDADAHCELSLALLGSGRLTEGWQEYEWRWRRPGAQARRHTGAHWDGDRSRQRRLLLWSEQGIGDQIIYGSMIAELADSALRITLEMDPRLVTLFQRSFPRAAVVARQDPGLIAQNDYDCQAPLASLGRWLRPSFDAFPRHVGFLKADAARAGAFRARLSTSRPGMRVGISWASANREFGDRKTARLADWTGILRVPGVQFVDLQYGDTEEARDELRRHHGLEIAHFDDVDLHNDLEGLAALCNACDLVITVSNVTAHMAGALGRPVWLLLPRARGRLWYWFSGREDSPWYPSMRIFTQQTAGDWREVLDAVARELATLGVCRT